jgi:hypothetical protein
VLSLVLFEFLHLFQYVHIPKTGGTTIQALLKSVASYNHVVVEYHDGSLDDINWNRSACIFLGHRSMGWHIDILKNDPIYVVTVREPIDLAVSLFDYIRRNTFPMHDTQRKSFGNHSFSQAVLARNSILLSYVTYYQSFLLTGVTGCGSDKYSCVIENLCKAHVVATSERLDDILPQLLYVTGWIGFGIATLSTSSHNTAPTKSIVTDEALGILRVEAAKGLDAKMYDIAKQRHYHLTSVARQCLQ